MYKFLIVKKKYVLVKHLKKNTSGNSVKFKLIINQIHTHKWWLNRKNKDLSHERIFHVQLKPHLTSTLIPPWLTRNSNLAQYTEGNFKNSQSKAFRLSIFHEIARVNAQEACHHRVATKSYENGVPLFT